MKFKRTHYCGRISEADIDKEAVLSGWVHTVRDMGGVIFIDLRDKTGVSQVVFNESEFNKEIYSDIERLRNEFVIAVKGVVEERDEETYNPRIPTGTVELRACDIEILSKSAPIPFPVEDNIDVREDLRMKYRYIDLRRPKMYENLLLRNRVLKSVREYLEENEFVEVETPILTKSTPEGARDYLVPSRVHQGEFYALPQSPQVFKQILMVSGFDRYYQVARCFRDEDLRADRQPEFTQVDIETSFLSEPEILVIIEKLFKKIFRDVLDIDIKEDFEVLTYQDAMDRYGSDKPDTRFGLEIVDVTEEVKNSSFKVFTDALKNNGTVRSINIKGGNSFTRTEIEELTEEAINWGAKGMAWIAIDNDGNLRTILDKYFSKEDMDALLDKMGVEPGDMLIFSADSVDMTYRVLGGLRLYIADKLGLRKKDEFKFNIIIDFPQFEWSDEHGKYDAMHHPFTMPKIEDLEYLDTDLSKVRAQAYDFVLNGVELGSGSIRIYDRDLQEKMFQVIGLSDEEINSRFSHILEAFKYGTPPHGGFAFGLDRLVMLMAKEDSIREVIAFPKNREAECLLTEAPSKVADIQLEELGLITVDEEGNYITGMHESIEKKAEISLENLADMSMLNIDESSKVIFKNYIDMMKETTEELRRLDLSNYEETVNIFPIENSFRKDEVKKEFTREELLEGVPSYEGYVLVPTIIEE